MAENQGIGVAEFGENITQHNLTLKVIVPFGAFYPPDGCLPAICPTNYRLQPP